MATAAENKALVEELYSAFFTGDIDRWFSFIDENSALIEPASLPYGGTHRGAEAIRAAMGIIMEQWDDGRYDVEEIYATERSALAYGTMHWTSRATGQRVSFPLAERWTFNGRKVAEVAPIYSDTAMIRSVLGLDA